MATTLKKIFVRVPPSSNWMDIYAQQHPNFLKSEDEKKHLRLVRQKLLNSNLMSLDAL